MKILDGITTWAEHSGRDACVAFLICSLWAVLLLLLAPPARADTKVELGTGLTLYGHHGDGVWHQQDYGPYSIKDRAANLSIGLTGRAFGVGWRAGVQYLGRYGSVCQCLSSDRAYEEFKKGNDVGWPASKFRTRGDGYGLYASVLPEWHIGRGWFLQAEVGVGYYGVSNEVKVTEWRPATDDTYLRWGTARLLEVSNGRKWKLTTIYGIGISRGWTTVAVKTMEISKDGALLPVVDGRPVLIEVRHGF